MRKTIRDLMNKRRQVVDSNNVVLCKANHCLDSAPARFRSKVRPDPLTGCWIWTAGVRRTRYKNTVYAYGTYSIDGSVEGQGFAHRYAYEFFVGPIPRELEIDHLCHNKLCVNPAHLEAVTHQENCARRKKSGPYPDPNSIRSRKGAYAGRYE